MKKYYFHTSKYSNQELGSIREQYDIVSYLLSVMTILNVEPLREIDSKEADFVIFVDKMSRLFWGEGDKIHSIQYPFLLKEKEGFLISLFQGRIIESQTMAILSTIIRDKNSIVKSIENMLDVFMDAMNEFEILDNNYAQFCWELLLYLLSFETGYLRYDHDEDENRVDPILHPVDHIDLFYSSNSTFKIGLQDRIDVDDLKSILSINEKCYSINYHRDKR